MNTEITENIRGWVFYDAQCPICSKWVERSHGFLGRRGFHPVPLQSDWAIKCLGPTADKPLTEIKLMLGDGRIFGGADAIIEIASAIWWAWPLYLAAYLPGVRWVLRRIYRTIAKNRHCFDGKCNIAEEHTKRRSVTRTFLEFP